MQRGQNAAHQAEEEDELVGGLAQQVNQALRLRPRRILLVLNLGGLLNDREQSWKYPDAPHTLENRYAVWNRPGKDAFIDWVFTKFDVAVWTSANPKNQRPLVQHLFGEERAAMLKFCWTQEQCELVIPAVPVNPAALRRELFCKPLRRILSCYEYGKRNVLILDNKAVAVEQGHDFSYLLLPEFTREQVNTDTGLMRGNCLWQYLDSLHDEAAGVDAFSVPDFVQRRPYHLWTAYAQVLALASTSNQQPLPRVAAATPISRLPHELRVRSVFTMLTGNLTFE